MLAAPVFAHADQQGGAVKGAESKTAAEYKTPWPTNKLVQRYPDAPSEVRSVFLSKEEPVVVISITVGAEPEHRARSKEDIKKFDERFAKHKVPLAYEVTVVAGAGEPKYNFFVNGDFYKARSDDEKLNYNFGPVMAFVVVRSVVDKFFISFPEIKLKLLRENAARKSGGTIQPAPAPVK